MSDFNRRKFLRKMLGVGALSGLVTGCAEDWRSSADTGGSPEAARQASRKEAGGEQTTFQYAMCNEIVQDRSWAEQCELISKAGYTGVEIAPFTLVESRNAEGVQDIPASERQALLQTMQEKGLSCVGLHWLLASPPDGLHFTTSDEELRQRSIDYLDHLIDFCADLDGKYMIFGSPDQRSAVEGMTVQGAMDNFADGLSQVAGHAEKRGVKILVEPLTSDQTNVVNTLEEAMQIVRRVDHPAIQTMFDFHNTADETQPLDELIREYYEHIYHVHVQEMDGTYLGTGNAVNDYVGTFQVLKDRGYDRWISLEVFDFEPGGTTIAQESMKTLQKIESKLS